MSPEYEKTSCVTTSSPLKRPLAKWPAAFCAAMASCEATNSNLLKIQSTEMTPHPLLPLAKFVKCLYLDIWRKQVKFLEIYLVSHTKEFDVRCSTWEILAGMVSSLKSSSFGSFTGDESKVLGGSPPFPALRTRSIKTGSTSRSSPPAVAKPQVNTPNAICKFHSE
jgi:hypothetical protein